MTDSVTFYKTTITQVTQFVQIWENLKLIADRITADSFLSGQAATAAQAGGRSDLTAANFDNLKAAIAVVETLLENTNGSVNSGGAVWLAFYKMM